MGEEMKKDVMRAVEEMVRLKVVEGERRFFQSFNLLLFCQFPGRRVN